QHGEHARAQRRRWRRELGAAAQLSVADAGDEITNGIVQVHLISPLPARLDHAGDLTLGGQIAQRDPRELQFAIERARTARQFATVANAGGGGIARQLRELQTRGETLFERELFVQRGSAQLVTARGVLLGQALALLVAFNRTSLRHTLTLSRCVLGWIALA